VKTRKKIFFSLILTVLFFLYLREAYVDFVANGYFTNLPEILVNGCEIDDPPIFNGSLKVEVI